MKTLIVIGGGASGMMSAITAARNKNIRVILFERQQRVGKKLLSTGNGRCNLTNINATKINYHGNQKGFVDSVLDLVPPQCVLDMFRELGLVTKVEYGGRVYPLSNSANSVVDILRYAMEEFGVTVNTTESVKEVKKHKDKFVVKTEVSVYRSDYVIVACGGCAGTKYGGVKDGYDILQSLGHKRTKLYPSLVQLVTESNEYTRALKGVKADTVVKLTGCKEVSTRGEVLFTEKGLSGPAIFDISRNISVYPNDTQYVHLDLLAEYTESEAKELIFSKCSMYPALDAGNLLVGIVHNRLGKMIVKYTGVDQQKKLSEITDADKLKIAKACKDFNFKIKATESFDQAQVTAGGIDTTEFNQNTLESKLVKGLYSCGEVLDVDGDCGGYNLQWAWASGIVAGRLGE